LRTTAPRQAAPDVLAIDATRFDSALASLACERLHQPIIDQEKPPMNMYVEIQIQLPADGTGFVAQWYTGTERSGRAFPLCNIGELLFFAYFTGAPLIVPHDATRAMLHERGYNVLSAAP